MPKHSDEGVSVKFIPDEGQEDLPEAVEIDLNGAFDTRPDQAGDDFVGISDQLTRMAFVHQFVPTVFGQQVLEVTMKNLLVLQNSCLTEHIINAQKRLGVLLDASGMLAPPLAVLAAPMASQDSGTCSAGLQSDGTRVSRQQTGPIITGPWGK